MQVAIITAGRLHFSSLGFPFLSSANGESHHTVQASERLGS